MKFIWIVNTIEYTIDNAIQMKMKIGLLTLISPGYFGGWVARGGGGGGGLLQPPSDLGRGSRDRRETTRLYC